MKLRRAFLVALVLGLAGAAMLAAQDSKREQTVEELYLEKIEMQILREQAFADDRELKILVLDDLEALIEQGNTGRDVELILEYMALEGIVRTVRESNRLINYFPEVRRRAANLLGRVGGVHAKEALITVLIKDNEPMVKAEAAYALGVIGENDSNEVVRALIYSLEQEDLDQPDNNFAYAVCLSLEKIARENNGIEDPAAYRALVRIAQGSYIRTVQNKALATLEELRQYQ
jgi:HEAT repeat protein